MSPVSAGSESTHCALILVVEDEPVILEFLCEILQQEGFATEAKNSADEALEFLDRYAEKVCLLLTDITMPGSLNGAALANLSGSRWPSIPILIMSGLETPESSGVTHPVSFIRKPWAIGQMLDCVNNAMKLPSCGVE
ncbi:MULTISPECIES: response regulator [Pseudomonas]|uniref:Response regulator n=1 Tax=Pseudomonas cucumis TaxID=2954082 RepID=A0ABY9F0D7_9PSED|nr:MULTISPECIES: response regulator [Pseudomonas]MDR8367440.1 response regulator [Pseudomonas sp. JL3]URM28308.1 response regulator [Pseudomonas frederiksbergensis]WLG85611.1 response regulator [Pseudomonas cucumis]